VSNRYNNPKVYITENGSAEYEPDIQTALNDEERRLFLEDHLRACSNALSEGVQLEGYFAWSLMDNFGTLAHMFTFKEFTFYVASLLYFLSEWQFGYQRRFGLYHVDFQTQKRTPKSSAIYYRDTIDAHGENVRLLEDGIST
jgi:beta-glucosidase